MEETPKPAKDSPEYEGYLRAKLEGLEQDQTYAKMYGDDAWVLVLETEARKVNQELEGRA